MNTFSLAIAIAFIAGMLLGGTYVYRKTMARMNQLFESVMEDQFHSKEER